jgi:hypothetical protein
MPDMLDKRQSDRRRERRILKELGKRMRAAEEARPGSGHVGGVPVVHVRLWVLLLVLLVLLVLLACLILL